MTSKRQRLDELLVQRGLAASRAQARALIMAGRVLHGTERLDKPGKEYPAEIALTLEQPPRFVSRGGEKLDGFLRQFGVDSAECARARRGRIHRRIHGLRAAGRRRGCDLR